MMIFDRVRAEGRQGVEIPGGGSLGPDQVGMGQLQAVRTRWR